MRPKPVTKDIAICESQNTRKRPREEEDQDNDMSDSEKMANVIAEQCASGRKERPKAVPEERNKHMRLVKNGLGGTEVYESLMALVCTELVRRRLLICVFY